MQPGNGNCDETKKLRVRKFRPQLYLRSTKRAMLKTSPRTTSGHFEKKSIFYPYIGMNSMPGLKRQVNDKSLPNTQERDNMESSTKCAFLSATMVGK